MTKEPNSSMEDGITFHPIGYMRSSHKDPRMTPIQPVFAAGCVGRAEILPKYGEGLKDLDGFSHVIVLYQFHLLNPPASDKPILTVTPFLEDRPHGIFATRHPRRPNPIGLSVLKLIRREGNALVVDGVDILDGTPILDVKPYVSRFDQPENARNGWVDSIDEHEAQLRGRRGA